jgi:hypothetical protein
MAQVIERPGWRCTMPALVFAVLFAATLGAQRSGVSIFVGADQSPEGFVKPALVASAKDLQGYIKDSNRHLLVDSPEKATIVVRVIARGESGSESLLTMPVGDSLLSMPVSLVNAVAVRIEVGTHTDTLRGFCDLSWRQCAGQVWSELDKWIVANATALAAQGR